MPSQVHLLRNRKVMASRHQAIPLSFYSVLMEYNAKLRENCLKPCVKDDFSFESPSSKGFLQELHHLDQFQANGSSSNPIFGVQPQCYDSFNNFMDGCSSDFDFYECKPFADNSGHGHVMDNFQSGGCLNLPQRNPSDIMGSDRSYMALTTCQDIQPINFIVPDELSCITAENGYNDKAGMNKNRTLPTTLRTNKGRKSSLVVKGQWTPEEDRLLIQLVQQNGVRKWSHIAQMLPGRIGKQCRERWHNHLRPDIKKDTWSEEEDKILIKVHAEIGNKWAEIAKRLPGRTENSIKNHWNATKRRQYSKRKCRSKYPRGSLLQEYIKGLNLDSTTLQNRRRTAPENTAIEALNPEPHTIQVTDYDFGEVPDFCFDGNLFQESCSMDNIVDDMPCDPVVDENKFEIEMAVDMTPVVECEVKKEMDLVEMMSRVKQVQRVSP